MSKKYVVDKKEPIAKKKDGVLKRISKFFKETRAELKKVIWPTREQLVKLSMAVVAFVVVFGALSGGFDYLMTYLLKLTGTTTAAEGEQAVSMLTTLASLIRL